MDTIKTVRYALVDTKTNKILLKEDSKQALYIIGGRMNRRADNKRVKIVKIVITEEYIEE